jgi:hypothetical protein
LYKKESLDAKYLRAVGVDPQLGEHVSSLRVVTSDGGVIQRDDSSDDRSDEEHGSIRSNCRGSGEVTTNEDGRPDDCDCSPLFEDLPCWPCYRGGFEEPNPNVEEDE